jgi:hypothetical protein
VWRNMRLGKVCDLKDCCSSKVSDWEECCSFKVGILDERAARPASVVRDRHATCPTSVVSQSNSSGNGAQAIEDAMGNITAAANRKSMYYWKPPSRFLAIPKRKKSPVYPISRERGRNSQSHTARRSSLVSSPHSSEVLSLARNFD